ncbi:MAG: DNA-binding protein Alba [Candidatus Micrarchaeota archaeon]
MQNRPPRDPSERNVIYVGKKETMAYVLAVVTQFNSGLSEVHVKARGKSIVTAVDVSQIVIHRFMRDLQVKSVTLGTEELTSEDGRQTKVSSMDILLGK